MKQARRASQVFRGNLGLILAATLFAGCNLIFGTGDIDYTDTTGGGGTGPTTTASASGGTGGTSSAGGMSTSTAGGGGTAPCVEGTTMACYSGPPNTRSVGSCVDGIATCDADGAWGACAGQVLPEAEDCYSAADEDCNGDGICLDDDGLVVRYFMDEAASGTAPMSLLDSGPAPAANLGASYVGTMAFTEEDGSRAVHWDAPNEDGIFIAPVSTKLKDAFDGSLTATIEVVARINITSIGGSRLFFVGQGDTADNLSVLAKLDTFEFRSNSFTLTKVFSVVHPTTWAVYHMVVDRSAAAIDRHRLYIDGVRVNTTNDPLDTQPLSVLDTNNSAVGNRDIGNRSLDGSIGYVSLYTTAFSDARIDHQRSILSVGHDANNTPHLP